MSVNAFTRLRSTRGVIDLASVLVGVLVLGIVSSIATVSIVGVVNVSADKTAIGEIHAARTSELAARVSAREFQPSAELIAGGFSLSRPRLVVNTDANRTCYLAVAASTTGTVYFGSSQSKSATELIDVAATGCVGPNTVKAMAKSVCTVALGSAAACTKWN